MKKNTQCSQSQSSNCQIDQNIVTRINAIIPNMEGWCSIEKALKLAEIIYCNDLKKGVELGVFGGRSAMAIALALDQLDSNGKIYAVDTWRKDDSLEGENDKENSDWWSKINLENIYNGFLTTVMAHHVTDHVNILRMRSDEAFKIFDDESLDFIHQDSNHSECVTMREIEIYFPKLKSGGFWISDDAKWTTTQKSIGFLNKNCDVFCDGGDWIIFKKH